MFASTLPQKSSPGGLLSRSGGLLGLLAAALALFGLLAAGLGALLPSGDELARRAEAELAQALGVNVKIGAVHWRLLPSPAIVVEDLATVQDAPVSIRLLTLYPELMPLVRKQVGFSRVELEGVTLPQRSLAQLKFPSTAEDGAFQLSNVPLAELAFTRVLWVSRNGLTLNFAGSVDFDPGWRPRQLQVRLPDAGDPAEMHLQRQAQSDSWTTAIKIGGGTLDGQLQLDTSLGDGHLRLSGRLQPKGIEVSSLLRAFNRRSFLAGRASGQTTLTAEGPGVGGLVRSLRTQTRFTMGRSTLVNFDLDKAVRTLGRQHDGQTRLDSVSAQLVTQNSADGMAFSFSDIKASSGALSASGSARLYRQRINAEFAVDLVDGIVGVPLTISGPVSKVSVSMPAGAVAGAAAGTVLLPGVGTVIGARVGAAIGNLFGGSDTPAPARKSP